MTISRGGSLIIGNKDGDAAFCADLAPDVRGLSLDPTLNTDGESTIGVEFVEVARTSWQRTMSVGTMYRGALFDQVSKNGRKGVVIARVRDGYWIGGDYTTDGPTKQSPSAGLLTGGFSFMPTDDWVSGSVSVPFSFSSDGDDLDVAAAADAAAVAFVAITASTGAAKLEVEIGTGSPQDLGSGQRIVPLTVGTSALTFTQNGAGALSGFVFVGTVEAIND